jgi:acyl-coenzyme A thioesterase PaaI-like protein
LRGASDEAIQSFSAALDCFASARNDGIAGANALPLSVGRRAATAEARITDAKGRLLAHATTTCLVFEIAKGT